MNIKSGLDYAISHLKSTCEEKSNGKSQEDILKPNQQLADFACPTPKAVMAGETQANKPKAAVTEIQSSLMSQIIMDTQEQLREEIMKEVKAEIGTKYTETSERHMVDVKS